MRGIDRAAAVDNKEIGAGEAMTAGEAAEKEEEVAVAVAGVEVVMLLSNLMLFSTAAAFWVLWLAERWAKERVESSWLRLAEVAADAADDDDDDDDDDNDAKRLEMDDDEDEEESLPVSMAG